jgi:hypothetical protein
MPAGENALAKKREEPAKKAVFKFLSPARTIAFIFFLFTLAVCVMCEYIQGV